MLGSSRHILISGRQQAPQVFCWTNQNRRHLIASAQSMSPLPHQPSQNQAMWFKSIAGTAAEPLTDGLQVPCLHWPLEAGPLQPQRFLQPSLLSRIALISTKAISNPSAFAHTVPLPSSLSLPISCNQALPPPSQPVSLPSSHASPQTPMWALTYQASLHSGDTVKGAISCRLSQGQPHASVSANQPM